MNREGWMPLCDTGRKEKEKRKGNGAGGGEYCGRRHREIHHTDVNIATFLFLTMKKKNTIRFHTVLYFDLLTVSI
jgi:hypothetical protein